MKFYSCNKWANQNDLLSMCCPYQCYLVQPLSTLTGMKIKHKILGVKGTYL
ncbi:hypothetical protein Pyn_39721 [Prunus yedoensis var. nudiflora]|uniref:Uncharacterized protein n=1 Tax=Prunus yedoensis var. nudiflora TaxID=2094558 RepID=A0A314Y1Q0_PRUYE|nr:hypothetical protein Pyn_39721 [Prunus yedoensis var. nudiflora]